MSDAKVAAALIAAEKNNLTQPAAIPAQGFTRHKQKNNTKGKKHRDTH
jgi:hypothetical protein